MAENGSFQQEPMRAALGLWSAALSHVTSVLGRIIEETLVRELGQALWTKEKDSVLSTRRHPRAASGESGQLDLLCLMELVIRHWAVIKRSVSDQVRTGLYDLKRWRNSITHASGPITARELLRALDTAEWVLRDLGAKDDAESLHTQIRKLGLRENEPAPPTAGDPGQRFALLVTCMTALDSDEILLRQRALSLLATLGPDATPASAKLCACLTGAYSLVDEMQPGGYVALQATQALKAIGSAAVPYLAAFMRKEAERTDFKDSCRDICCAVDVLGSILPEVQAASAIPDMIRYVRKADLPDLAPEEADESSGAPETGETSTDGSYNTTEAVQEGAVVGERGRFEYHEESGVPEEGLAIEGGNATGSTLEVPDVVWMDLAYLAGAGARIVRELIKLEPDEDSLQPSERWRILGALCDPVQVAVSWDGDVKPSFPEVLFPSIHEILREINLQIRKTFDLIPPLGQSPGQAEVLWVLEQLNKPIIRWIAEGNASESELSILTDPLLRRIFGSPY